MQSEGQTTTLKPVASRVSSVTPDEKWVTSCVPENPAKISPLSVISEMNSNMVGKVHPIVRWRCEGNPMDDSAVVGKVPPIVHWRCEGNSKDDRKMGESEQESELGKEKYHQGCIGAGWENSEPEHNKMPSTQEMVWQKVDLAMRRWGMGWRTTYGIKKAIGLEASVLTLPIQEASCHGGGEVC